MARPNLCIIQVVHFIGLDDYGCAQPAMKRSFNSSDLPRLLVPHLCRSSDGPLGLALHRQLLPRTVLYQRAAGYLSSGAFASIPDAFAEFFQSGGVMEIVCSDQFSGSDLEALSRAVVDRPHVRRRWATVPDAFASRRWPWILSFLIAHDLLKVKVAFRTPERALGLFHEKTGIFHDADGHRVAFCGSANESGGGLMINFESVEVFFSWENQTLAPRVDRLQSCFDHLWRDETMGLRVLDLESALREGLSSTDWQGSASRSTTRGLRARNVVTMKKSPPELVAPPANLKLWAHQERTIVAWGNAGGKGIVEMATGAGKTLTALVAASRAYDRIGPGVCILLTAPLIHLIDQWRDVAHRFGLRPIRCAEGRRRWIGELAGAVFALNTGSRPVLSIAATAATFGTPEFQEIVGRVRKPLLLIADEVHNYGSSKLTNALPSNAVLRLGLSATPQRWRDSEGTRALADYFGEVVFTYSLKEAVSDGVLAPYRYYPKLVTLDESEFERYIELSQLIGRYMHGQHETEISPKLQRLLLRRARLVGSARNKLGVLREHLLSRPMDAGILVYCGDGSVEGPAAAESLRQVDQVVRMMGTELGISCSRYVADTPPSERRRLVRAFIAGSIRALVAIRCLDEGVDIPGARTAYILASSTNPRQFIQRRGRLLRKSPGKTRADIFDFFVRSPSRHLPRKGEEWRAGQALIRSQVRRAREFADAADNGPDAREVLMKMTKTFDLWSEWGKS